MKKLIAAFFIVLTACTPALPSPTPVPVQTKTATPLVMPSLPPVTPVPTKTPTIITPTPMAETDFFYTVTRGDTLSGISGKTGVSMESLVALNHLASEDWIYEGQVLLLVDEGQVLTYIHEQKGKQLLVILSTQKTYALDSGKEVNSFLISSGIPAYPTRVGKYAIWVKLYITRMTGPGYDLPNVLWTSYFDQSRGFHAKYWNNVYGRPSSHGCINMTEADAKWLYDWADPVTKGNETYATAENPGTTVWVLP